MTTQLLEKPTSLLPEGLPGDTALRLVLEPLDLSHHTLPAFMPHHLCEYYRGIYSLCLREGIFWTPTRVLCEKHTRWVRSV